MLTTSAVAPDVVTWAVLHPHRLTHAVAPSVSLPTILDQLAV